MLQDRLGVSPSPLVGKTQDSKDSGILKNFRENAENKSELKKHFESALKEKLQKQMSDLEKKKDLSLKEEFRAEQKKKSSRGTKKKTTEVEKKMVSNDMVSNESVLGTPEPKNPAEIKINSSENSNKVQSLDKASQAVVESLADLQATSGEVIQDELQADLEADAAADAMKSLEAELAKASGYEAMSSGEQTEIAELKNSEVKSADEKAANASSLAFEKNVLSQLQRENAFQQPGQFGDSNSQSDPKSGDQSDLNPNELHQASGQSHASFKGQLQGAGDLSANSPASNAERLEASRESNINEIMNQAQYLVKKGGGEVNVKMSPEGLGEVNLKVQFINGQLSIEMQTADKDVKKLIEDSLSDLKSGLAAHRLSLEHVKIDTVNATNTENNSNQTQSNLQQQNSNEQSSRDFWMGMQQQSQQRSNSGRGGDFSLNPQLNQNVATPKVSTAQAARTYGGTKGATINRVA
jgi:flagellar hook-length control protein FliK